MIATAITVVVYLSIATPIFFALGYLIKEMITSIPDKMNQEQPLPTYEEIEQSDEKQTPSYKEALKKGEQTKLEMNRSQPISSEQTCLASEASPPYSTFFDFKEYSPLKPISTKPQPDIEPTEIKPSVGLYSR